MGQLGTNALCPVTQSVTVEKRVLHTSEKLFSHAGKLCRDVDDLGLKKSVTMQER
jgi:hypothetical protein